MDVRHLQLLRELADRGSVTAVATATYRTPSAVSQQLRTAQREFGAVLVEQEGRGLRLTDAGRLLAEGALDVVTALERVQARWDAFRHGPGGTVSIAAVPSAAEFLLPGLLGALAETSTTVHCHDMEIAESAYSSLTHDYDLVVFTPSTPLADSELHARLLAREPLDIALPVSHPLGARTALTSADVVDEDWIAVPDGYPFNAIRTSVEAATGTTTRVVQRVLDNRVAEALVANGHGIAVLPRFTTHNSRVTLRPLTDVPAVRYVTAVARPDRAQRLAVQQVLDTLTTIASHPASRQPR